MGEEDVKENKLKLELQHLAKTDGSDCKTIMRRF